MTDAISTEDLKLDKKYSIGYGIREPKINGIFVGMRMKNGDLYPKFIVDNKEILIGNNVPIYDVPIYNSSKGGRSRIRRKRKQTRKRYKKYTTYK